MGPREVSYKYTADKMTMSAMGKETSADIKGAYMHDGSSGDLVLARLPLKEGYEAGIYVAGQDGSVKLNKLSVTGKETINGVSCFKCEMAEVDDPTAVAVYYIGEQSKMAQKIVAPLAGMPGATMTIELKN